MMPQKIVVRVMALVLCVLALAACASGSSTPTAQTDAPAPTPATGAQSSPAATSAPAAAAPTLVASPVPPPPNATPFPLQAGWWDSSVCYEVFVRSFYDSNGDGVGDLNGLIEKLDYINDGSAETQTDLGANCIWLMPVAEAASYHGYDTVDYYTIEKDYGTNDDFKRLMEEAHKRGINVLIDLVLNHTSSEHPWFKDAQSNPASPYRDFYIWSAQDPGYRGPWGDVAWHKSPASDEYYYGLFWEGMPDLNYRNPAVTAEAQKISQFWREEMGADGFRLDAIKHLIEDGTVQENTPETMAWLRGYRAFLEASVPGTFTVGEIFSATPSILEPYYPDQLDDYFVFDISERIINAATSGNGKPYLSAVDRVDGDLPYQRYSPFLTNHDQNRVMGLLGSDVGKAKVTAMALLTIPGLPFVYYGEEIGMTGAKGSPPKVDEPLRTPMQWTGEAGAGFTSGTPWEAPQSNTGEVNVAAQDADAGSLLNTYRKLIHLHTSQVALGTGDFTPFTSSERALAAFVRQAGDEAVLVAINFDDKVVEGATLSLEASGLPAGSYALEPLFGDLPAAQLTVAENGAVTEYAPFPAMEPYAGAIYKLTRQ